MRSGLHDTRRRRRGRFNLLFSWGFMLVMGLAHLAARFLFSLVKGGEGLDVAGFHRPKPLPATRRERLGLGGWVLSC